MFHVEHRKSVEFIEECSTWNVRSLIWRVERLKRDFAWIHGSTLFHVEHFGAELMSSQGKGS